MRNAILKRGLAIALLMTIVSLTLAAPEQAQPDKAKQPANGAFDPAAMQDKILNIYKQQLGVTEEEWTVLRPRLSKVRQLMQRVEVMTAMMRWNVIARPLIKKEMEQSGYPDVASEMVRGFIEKRLKQQSMPTQGSQEEQNAFQKAMTELQETLQKPAPSRAEIQTRMLALRGAKEKTKQELIEAQKELREVLTLKQEAQLLLMGVLE